MGAACRLGCPDTRDLPVGGQDDGADRRIGVCAALDQLGLLDGQPHGGLEPHNSRCGDAAAARRRSDSTAAAGSAALYTAEPATKQSTPASAASAMVSSLMPPSISTTIVNSPASTSRRASATFASTSAMNFWPPKPGSTDMTSSVSKSRRISRYGSRGVPGLTLKPAFAPAARMSRATATGLSVASAWNV